MEPEKDRPTDRTAEADLATLVVLTGLAIADAIRESFRADGIDDIRFSQVFVFALLAQGPCTVGTIAEQMGFSHQAASQMVAELERTGLARRTENPDDRRSRLVELTPDGHRALRIGLDARDQLLERLAATTSPRSLATTARVVSELLDLATADQPVRVRDLGFPRGD